MPTPTIETTEYSVTLWFSGPEWTSEGRATVTSRLCPICPLDAANVKKTHPEGSSLLRCETLFAPYDDAEIIRAIGHQDGQLTMEPLQPQDIRTVQSSALCITQSL